MRQPISHTRDWEVASSRLPAGDATLARTSARQVDGCSRSRCRGQTRPAATGSLGLTDERHPQASARRSFESSLVPRPVRRACRRETSLPSLETSRLPRPRRLMQRLPIRSDGRGNHARDYEGQNASRRGAGEVMPESTALGRRRRQNSRRASSIVDRIAAAAPAPPRTLAVARPVRSELVGRRRSCRPDSAARSRPRSRGARAS